MTFRCCTAMTAHSGKHKWVRTMFFYKFNNASNNQRDICYAAAAASNGDAMPCMYATLKTTSHEFCPNGLRNLCWCNIFVAQMLPYFVHFGQNN